MRLVSSRSRRLSTQRLAVRLHPTTTSTTTSSCTRDIKSTSLGVVLFQFEDSRSECRRDEDESLVASTTINKFVIVWRVVSCVVGALQSNIDSMMVMITHFKHRSETRLTGVGDGVSMFGGGESAKTRVLIAAVAAARRWTSSESRAWQAGSEQFGECRSTSSGRRSNRRRMASSGRTRVETANSRTRQFFEPRCTPIEGGCTGRCNARLRRHGSVRPCARGH